MNYTCAGQIWSGQNEQTAQDKGSPSVRLLTCHRICAEAADPAFPVMFPENRRSSHDNQYESSVPRKRQHGVRRSIKAGLP
jgi:hypothetical protein